MKNLRFAVAAVLALSASSAFAGTLTTPTPSSGSTSDYFLVVVNQTTGKSEIVDLGVATSSALTNGQTFNVDPSLATNLGAGTLTYEVVSGDTSYSAANFLTYSGNALYTTSSNATTLSWSALTVNNGLTGLNNWFSSAGGGASSSWATVGGYNTLVSGGTATTGNWGPVSAGVTMPGNNLQLTGLVANAAVGTAINMYSMVTTTAGSDVAQDAVTVTKLGAFTLTGSTLSFSNVPVPAALWLLASGIFGLGAAGRRRKIAA